MGSRRGAPSLLDKNCIILNTKGLCLLCYEECPANLIDRQRELKETSVNFTRLVSRYLGFNVEDIVDEQLMKVGRKRLSTRDEDGKKVDKIGFEMCDRCAALVQGFCHIQFQMASNEMLLENCVKSISGIIKDADVRKNAGEFTLTDEGDGIAKQTKTHTTRLSTGGFRGAHILRSKLYKKSVQKLSKSYPIIRLKKICKSGDWIPILNKRDNQVAKESNVIFASLLGCIVSFWIVISLSFLDPNELQRKYARTPLKQLQQLTDEVDVDFPLNKKPRKTPVGVVPPAKKAKSSRQSPRSCATPKITEKKATEQKSNEVPVTILDVNPPEAPVELSKPRPEAFTVKNLSVTQLNLEVTNKPTKPLPSGPCEKAFRPVTPSHKNRLPQGPIPHQSSNYIPRPTPHYPAPYYDGQQSSFSGYNYPQQPPAASGVAAAPPSVQSYPVPPGQPQYNPSSHYDASSNQASSYNYNYNSTTYNYNSSSWGGYNNPSNPGSSQVSQYPAQGNSQYDNLSYTQREYGGTAPPNYDYNYDYSGYTNSQPVVPTISPEYLQQQNCVQNQYAPRVPSESGAYSDPTTSHYYNGEPSYTSLTSVGQRPFVAQPGPVTPQTSGHVPSQPSFPPQSCKNAPGSFPIIPASTCNLVPPAPMDQENTAVSTSPSDEPSLTCEDPQMFDFENCPMDGYDQNSPGNNHVMFPESHWRQVQGSSPPVSCKRPGCSEQFTSQAQLKLHLVTHGKFNCSYCHLAFSKAHNLAHHEKTRHAKPSTSTTGGKHKCPRCNFSTQSQHNYFLHFLGEHLSLPLYDKPCEICNKPFILGTKRINRKNHFKAYHDIHSVEPSEVFVCPNRCNAKFLKDAQLKDHVINYCSIAASVVSETESVAEITLTTALATVDQIVM